MWLIRANWVVEMLFNNIHLATAIAPESPMWLFSRFNLLSDEHYNESLAHQFNLARDLHNNHRLRTITYPTFLI